MVSLKLHVGRRCWHRFGLGRQPSRGVLLTELVVSMGIVSGVVIMLATTFGYERQLCRHYYYRCLAMEIVDGEMEILAAGEWTAYAPGTHVYQVHAQSACNLPPGEFQLIVTPQSLRLQWCPRRFGCVVWREIPIK